MKYAQKCGVNIKGRLFLYGSISWGTEPWIITVGDNVHITDGVRFITHDGEHFYFGIEFLIWKLQSPLS